MIKSIRQHHLIYLTANEKKFFEDFHNIFLMTKHHPGVELVNLIFVISEIKSSHMENKLTMLLESIISKVDWINLKIIVKKGNRGRDFSSAKVGLDELSKFANPADMVMIRNRSALGPFKKNWYADFISLFESNPNLGMVGNTINLLNHPRIAKNQISPHIQTYVYLSGFNYFDKIRSDFPGMNEVNRLKIISQGEIGLSKLILNKGLMIACLFWQNEVFGQNTEINNSLPLKDVKKSVKNLPFKHRKGLNIIQSSFFKLRFYFKLMRIKRNLRRSRNVNRIIEIRKFY